MFVGLLLTGYSGRVGAFDPDPIVLGDVRNNILILPIDNQKFDVKDGKKITVRGSVIGTFVVLLNLDPNANAGGNYKFTVTGKFIHDDAPAVDINAEESKILYNNFDGVVRIELPVLEENADVGIGQYTSEITDIKITIERTNPEQPPIQKKENLNNKPLVLDDDKNTWSNEWRVETIPEPVSILGSGVAVAFGIAFKRELGKAKKK